MIPTSGYQAVMWDVDLRHAVDTNICAEAVENCIEFAFCFEDVLCGKPDAYEDASQSVSERR